MTAARLRRALKGVSPLVRGRGGRRGAPAGAPGRRRSGEPLAVLVDAYPHVYGGSQRITHVLAAGLGAEGWRSLVVTPAAGPLTDRLAADGLAFEVVTVPSELGRYGHAAAGRSAARAAMQLPRYWARLWWRLRRRRPAMVHVADLRGLVLAAVPARLARIPVVLHVHALEDHRLLLRAAVALAAAVIVPSRAALERLPVLDRARRLVVVPSPVPARLREAEPVTLDSAPTVCTVARLHPEKGIDVLLEALAIVVRRVPGCTATVVGGDHPGLPEEGRRLRDQARTLGLEEAVRFAGFLERPDEVVGASRVYVHPARSELLPLAVLEAMAQGVAVVATDVGGIRDVIAPNASGLLVPPGDPTALAAAIVEVLRDDRLAERLREAGRQVATGERHTEAAVVAAVARCYRDLLP